MPYALSSTAPTQRSAPDQRRSGIFETTLMMFAVLLFSGCKSSAPASAPHPSIESQTPAYPARPTIPPPPFKIFHQDNDTYTLVTKPHVYRGAKCASEKYTKGPYPCGASYHGAGDYTLGDYKNPQWEDAVLLHPDGSETHLWDPDAPQTHPAQAQR